VGRRNLHLDHSTIHHSRFHSRNVFILELHLTDKRPNRPGSFLATPFAALTAAR
jgi:hypothetical protein